MLALNGTLIVSPLQMLKFGIGVTIGEGFTAIVNSCGFPGHATPFALV